MTRLELSTLVEKVICIRDRHRYELSISELDTLADICNVVDHNLDKLSEDADE